MIKKIISFLFENKTIRQTVAKNTFWLFSGEFLGRLLRTAIVIYAARILGAEGWGVFSYAITISALFSFFSDLGLSPIITREGSKNPEMREQYLSTAFFIKISLLLLSTLTIIFIVPLFTKIEATRDILPIIALTFIFDGLIEFGLSFNRALEKMEREALVKIIVNLIIVSLGIASLMFLPSAKSLAIAYAIGSGVGLLITITILRHYLKNLFSNFNKDLLWPILSSAWPFAIMGFSGAIMVNIDTVMIGWFRSASEVGYYSAAQRPIQLLYVIPNLLGSAVFPVMARFATKDNDKFRQILEKSITIVLAIGLPIAIGGAILGKDMITILFGSGYAPAATTFVILLFTLLLVLPNTLISGSLFAYNEQKNFLGFIVINAMINTSLNYLLIPSYGMPGAAIATLIANFSASIFIWNKMKKINYFSVISHLKIIALATLIMAVSASIFQYLHLNFFVNLLLSATIYIGLLISFKEPVIKEILSIFQLQNKSENQIL